VKYQDANLDLEMTFDTAAEPLKVAQQAPLDPILRAHQRELNFGHCESLDRDDWKGDTPIASRLPGFEHRSQALIHSRTNPQIMLIVG
jgi:hypothetical protein